MIFFGFLLEEREEGKGVISVLSGWGGWGPIGGGVGIVGLIQLVREDEGCVGFPV